MRNRLRRSKELHLERMFETRSEAWERVGLNLNVNQRAIRRARVEIVLLVPLLLAVLILYHHRVGILGRRTVHDYGTWLQWGTVVVLLVIGWTLARDVGRAAGPTMFRRMDPGTAGTVGFIIRLVTLTITVLIALSIAGVNTGSLVAGGAIAAVVVPLREPEPVDVKVRLNAGIRPSHVQAILHEEVSTPTRSAPNVLLEEIDGDDVVVRVQATPEHANQGAQLADEVITALASVTGEHEVARDGYDGRR